MCNVTQLDNDEIDYWVAAALRIKNPAANFGEDAILRPSLSWCDAGPLIEVHHIKLDPKLQIDHPNSSWIAAMPGAWRRFENQSPLVAAMQALIHSVYGERVPDEPRTRVRVESR